MASFFLQCLTAMGANVVRLEDALNSIARRERGTLGAITMETNAGTAPGM